MSWYSRTWAACVVRSCDEEVLRTRALERGWVQREEGGWLCPVHKPYGQMTDVAKRAAGEREDDR